MPLEENKQVREFLDLYVFTRNLAAPEEIAYSLVVSPRVSYMDYTIFSKEGKHGIEKAVIFIRQHEGRFTTNFRHMESSANIRLIETLDKYDEYAMYRSHNGRPTMYMLNDVEKLLEFLVSVEQYL